MMNGVRSRLICGLLLGSAALSARAFAETPAAATKPTAPATAPDLIRLKNGGMLRGTIAESEPGESVTIVLLTGETRRISAADVAYAGPADAAPSAAPPAPAATPPAPAATPPTGGSDVKPFAVVHAAEAQVDFVSNPSGGSLFRRNSAAGFIGGGAMVPVAAGYDEVCTAPCNASMPAGTHTFAMAQPKGNPIEADAITLPAGKSTLTGTYQDRTGTRVALIVAGVLGEAAGSAVIIAGLGGASDRTDVNSLVAGIALDLGGAIALVCGIQTRDKVKLTLTPGASPPAPAPSSSASSQTTSSRRDTSTRSVDDLRGQALPIRDALSGLTLTARF